MRVQREQKAAFVMQGSDGKTYRLLHFVERFRSDTLDGTQWIEGLSEFRLSTGEAVNQLADGSYQVVQTGVTLRRPNE